jgi:hypothetical protein
MAASGNGNNTGSNDTRRKAQLAKLATMDATTLEALIDALAQKNATPTTGGVAAAAAAESSKNNETDDTTRKTQRAKLVIMDSTALEARIDARKQRNAAPTNLTLTSPPANQGPSALDPAAARNLVAGMVTPVRGNTRRNVQANNAKARSTNAAGNTGGQGETNAGEGGNAPPPVPTLPIESKRNRRRAKPRSSAMSGNMNNMVEVAVAASQVDEKVASQ